MGNAELAVESLENTTRLLKWILWRVTSLRYIHLILSYSYWSLDVWDIKFGPFENQNFLSQAFTLAASVLFFIFGSKMEESSERIIQRLFLIRLFLHPSACTPPACLSVSRRPPNTSPPSILTSQIFSFRLSVLRWREMESFHCPVCLTPSPLISPVYMTLIQRLI